MRCVELVASDDVVGMVLDEVVFDFEVFPPMRCMSQEFNVDYVLC